MRSALRDLTPLEREVLGAGFARHYCAGVGAVEVLDRVTRFLAEIEALSQPSAATRLAVARHHLRIVSEALTASGSRLVCGEEARP